MFSGLKRSGSNLKEERNINYQPKLIIISHRRKKDSEMKDELMTKCNSTVITRGHLKLNPQYETLNSFFARIPCDSSVENSQKLMVSDLVLKSHDLSD